MADVRGQGWRRCGRALAVAALLAGSGVGWVLTPGRAAVAATGFGSTATVYHQDPAGSGVDAANTDLSPLRPAWTSPQLDGQIYGEPLVEGGRVVAATENNTVYALAANSGAILWHTHLAIPVPDGALACLGDINPTVGITSTPVIDPNRDEVFVIADEWNGSAASHHLVGLNLLTGEVMLDTPVDPPGSTPTAELQRPGLTLDAGRVIVGFGGNDGDCGPYHGWLVAEPETGGPPLRFEVSALPGDREGAIWMGGAAPLVDGDGNIWVATGNGAVDSLPYDDSDGVLKFNASLQLADYWAPSSWGSDNDSDLDLGSAAPALLPGGLLFQAGKSRTAYVLSQSALGHEGAPPLASTSICGDDVDGGNAVSGNVVYSPCLSGIVRTVVTPGSPPQMSVGSPSMTGSNGPPIVAGGEVWTIDGGGNLWGLDPSDLDTVVQGPFSLGGSVSNHFPTPTVADGLLLAPGDTSVWAFEGPAGLPPAPAPPPSFVVRPGVARDVAVGADGAVWALGINSRPGGFSLWRWTGSGWTGLSGGAVALAVDPAGRPWVVTASHQIFHWNGTSWSLVPGAATAVGVGANGSVWVLGTNPVPGGFSLWRWTGTGWIPLSGGAVALAVGPGGNPWVISSSHQIFFWNGAGWTHLPGAATDLAVASDGSAWAVGTTPVNGGFNLSRWTGRGWVPLAGGAVNVALDPNGFPWAVESNHQILSY